MKALPWPLVAALAACGGDNAPVVINEIYSGAVSGTPCFVPTPQSLPIRFRVSRGTVEGAAVTLFDESTRSTWNGTMTSASSFTVSPPPGEDTRMSIVAGDISGTSANVTVTTCATFRCCARLTGAAQVTAV